MALSKLFYLCNLIDDEVTENIIRFAQTTSNHSYRYWTTMDISYMTFISQKGTYPNYYQDRKNLLKQIAQENYFYIYIIAKNITKVYMLYHLQRYNAL